MSLAGITSSRTLLGHCTYVAVFSIPKQNSLDRMGVEGVFQYDCRKVTPALYENDIQIEWRAAQLSRAF